MRELNKQTMLKEQNVILGISLLCLGLLIAPYDALAKYLSEDIGILEIIGTFFQPFYFLSATCLFLKGKKEFLINLQIIN